MKIVHISTSDIRGGAARSAFRLHRALKDSGSDSSIYVAAKYSAEPSVHQFLPKSGLRQRARRTLRKEQVRRAFKPYLATRPGGYEHFRDDRTELGDEIWPQLQRPDIINLHWIADFIDYHIFFGKTALPCPTVWTLHDMNPFTGGCHFDDSCGRSTQQCGACPQLGSHTHHDLSYRIWARKKRALDQTRADRLFLIAPSNWLAAEARRSSILGRFSTTVIPYGVDTKVFRPNPSQDYLRQALDIPDEALVILFLAEYTDNRRKGFALLDQALKELNSFKNIFLLSLGSGRPETTASLPHLHLGTISNDSVLAALYSLADVFAIPSTQDNLPNTVLESMSCGTPVVGFDAGGIRDMVQDRETGFLVPAGDVRSLATALSEVLTDPVKRKNMSENCRRVALEKFPQELQATRYRRLYEALRDEPEEVSSPAVLTALQTDAGPPLREPPPLQGSLAER